jgi:hypothetical protein
MADLAGEDLDRRIAEWLGDEGFLPAQCGAGHEAEEGDVGFVCRRCFESAFGPDDLLRPGTVADAIRAHEEWTVQPRRPKPFSASLDLAISAVLRWFISDPSEWHISIGISTRSEIEWVFIRRSESPGIGIAVDHDAGGRTARVLARLLVEAMGKEAKEGGTHADGQGA